MTLGGTVAMIAAGFLCRSLSRIIACCDGLTDEEARWHPPARAANSLLALSWHALGNAEENILGLLARQEVHRQGAAEFDDNVLTADAIRGRWARLEEDLTRALEQLPVDALTRQIRAHAAAM